MSLFYGTIVIAQPDTASLHTELKGIQANWHSAYVVSDSLKLLKLLRPDVRIVRTTGVILRKQQALSHYRTRDTTGLLINTIDQKVNMQGELAVLTAHVHERDKGILYKMYVTDVLQLRQGVWQILHSQWTLLPGQWDKFVIDSTDIHSYAGTYESSAGRKLVIKVHTDHITLTNSQGRISVFVPRSKTHFFRPGEPDQIVFVNNNQQQPDFLLLMFGINSTVFHRKE